MPNNRANIDFGLCAAPSASPSTPVDDTPFIIGVITDLTGSNRDNLPPLADRQFATVDIDNIGSFLRAQSATIHIVVPDELLGQATITLDLKLDSLDSFHPDAIVAGTPILNELATTRSQIEAATRRPDPKINVRELLGAVTGRFPTLSLSAPPTAPAAVPSPPAPPGSPPADGLSAFEALLGEPDATGTSGSAHPRAIEAVDKITGAVLAQAGTSDTVSKDDISRLSDLIGKIDQRLTLQLNHILHHPDFQRLEASWRGLDYLVNHTETSSELQIRVLNLSRDELQNDSESDPHESSLLHRLVYEAPCATAGGQPFTHLVGDSEFSHSTVDIAALLQIARTANAAHLRFTASASPRLLGLDSWDQATGLPDLASRTNSSDHDNWHALRDSPWSKHLALIAPRVLGRLPYSRTAEPIQSFEFDETHPNQESPPLLWTGPAFHFAATVARNFVQTGIRGSLGDPTIEDLPYAAGAPQSESALTDQQLDQLSILGLIPLVTNPRAATVALFADHSLSP